MELHEQKAATSVPRAGALEGLDRELDRFEKSLERLAQILQPITNHHALRELDDVAVPEPPTELHMKVERLARQLSTLDRMMNEVAL